MIKRKLAEALVENKKMSVLLLGPRQVGKSTLIQNLKPDLEVNLADQSTFLEFTSNPKALLELIDSEKNPKSVFVDEVQRVPSILNTIQTIIDKKSGIQFYLTGSSARKLKRGRANLLPGRIFDYQLGPLIASEFNYKMNTKKVIQYGSLPAAYLAEKESFSKKLLTSYVGLYLKEEIQAEALTRNLEAFSRFLKSSILSMGQFVDYSKISKLAKISRHSCSRYFDVLADTLIGYQVFPFEECIESADLVKHSKLYFFDPGVYNSLIGNFIVSEDRIGPLAEQAIYTQIIHSAKSFDKSVEVSSFRTRGGFEIDFIVNIEGHIFPIEVKSTDNLQDNDVKNLKYFSRYYSKKHVPYLLHLGFQRKKVNGIWCLPWQEGLKEMGV